MGAGAGPGPLTAFQRNQHPTPIWESYRRRRASRPARSPLVTGASARRPALVALGLCMLLLGCYGLVGYVRDYARYRGFAPPAHPANVPYGSVTTSTFYSPALGARRRYLTYRPPNYAAAAARGERFPVLYLLHPPSRGPGAYVDIAGVAVRMDELIAAERIRPFLIVMPEGRHDGTRHDTEWANTPSGRHESFVLDTVRAADGRLATIPTRGARAIGGLSMGGYGATNIALHHLGTFGVLESWSGYFTQTPTSSFTGASHALLRANSPAAYVGSLSSRLRRLPLRAFFYEGRSDRVESIPRMFRFVRRFRIAGGRAAVSLYPGAHNWRLWRAQTPRMLQWTAGAFRR